MAEGDVADLRCIRVEVREGDNARVLKIVWNRWDGPFPPYCINTTALELQAAAVRKALRDLVARILEDGATAADPELRQLMREGSRLRRLLLDPAVVLDGAAEVKKVGRWLSGLKGDHRIHFSVMEGVHVPWGLVFEGDAPESGSDETLAACRKFWAVHYHLSSTYRRLQWLPSEERAALDVLPVVDTALFDKVRAYLSGKSGAAEPPDVALADVLFPGRTFLDQRKAFFARWRETAGTDRLICFYGHADGTSLGLGDETITVEDLRYDVNVTQDDDTLALWLLNGCHTAVGDPAGGFVEQTVKQGFYGFIGTEESIPNAFAMRFALAFLTSFLRSGRSLLHTMAELRLAHLPLSLLYSVYCNPAIRLAPPRTLIVDEEALRAVGNLSHGAVGLETV